MNVDAINAIPRRAAAASLEALKEQYARLAPKIAENANYLKEIREAARVLDAEHTKNEKLKKTLGPLPQMSKSAEELDAERMRNVRMFDTLRLRFHSRR